MVKSIAIGFNNDCNRVILCNKSRVFQLVAMVAMCNDPTIGASKISFPLPLPLQSGLAMVSIVQYFCNNQPISRRSYNQLQYCAITKAISNLSMSCINNQGFAATSSSSKPIQNYLLVVYSQLLKRVPFVLCLWGVLSRFEGGGGGPQSLS